MSRHLPCSLRPCSLAITLACLGLPLGAQAQQGGSADDAGPVLETIHVKWQVPGQAGLELLAGANNLTDKRYFTRTSDGNLGKMVGAPRMVYLQGRLAF